MPLILQSSYRAPAWLPGGHVQTIFPALFRCVARVASRAERLELADGDFLDLAWADQGNSRLAILSHGLEADLNTHYIQAMAAALIRHGWDVLMWNFRGCGREPNRLLKMYHSGATADLDAVVSHALSNHSASTIDLIGFSLGGNLTIKYLGENPGRLDTRLHRAVTFSVPCDLACSSKQLARKSNTIYMGRFLRQMRAKIRTKDRMFSGQLDLTGLDQIRTFQEFDERFTAPIHGFRSAEDYWDRSSCRPFIPHLTHPTLLVNAANDPFLGDDCYPSREAASSSCFHLEIPRTGGHVGFTSARGNADYFSESRAIAFLSET